MKKIIFSLTLLLFAVKSFSQQPSLPAYSKDYYLQKSKNQKTTGWVFLVGGSIMAIASVIRINEISNDPNLGFDETVNAGLAWAFVGVTGAVGAGCSAIFFRASKKNARKATSFAFNNQRLLFPQQNGVVVKIQPTITLKIGLGK